MENFFLTLSSFEELKLELFEKYKDEKIFVQTKNDNLFLSLSKNHILEKNKNNIKNESTKCIVCDFNDDFLKNIEQEQYKKPVYIIFNSLNDFLSFNSSLKNIKIILNPACILNNYQSVKKQTCDFCQNALFAISVLIFKSLVSEDASDYRIEIETLAKTFKFFSSNSEINFYNFFEFAFLLKKLFTLQKKLDFNFYKKIKNAYHLFNVSSCDDSAFLFMLNFVQFEFLKNKNFISFSVSSFAKRFKNYCCFFKKNAEFNSFNYLEKAKFSKLIKQNYFFIYKVMEKVFSLSFLFLKLETDFEKLNFNSKNFFKALSFAADGEDKNLFQFMKNLGYLDAV